MGSALGSLKDRKRLEAMREAGWKTAQRRFCSSLMMPKYVRHDDAVLGGQ